MKGALSSKGIWGGILALLPQVLQLAGVVDQETVTGIVSVAGGILAIIGRVQARGGIRGVL